MSLRPSMKTIRSAEGLLLVPALLGTALILVSTSRYGAGISPDSVGYIAAARNLAAGRGLILYDGSPMVDQPPLYPAILAVFRLLLRIDPLPASRLLSSLLLGLMVYLTGRLALRLLSSSRLWTGIAVAAVLLSTVPSEISVMAWTEPLFVCLSLFFLLAAERHIAAGDRRTLLTMAVITALACLTRYLGVALVFAGVGIVLVARRDESTSGWRPAILFLLVSLAPLLLWTARNYALSNSPFGERPPVSFTLQENFHFVWRTIAFWYLPAWSMPRPLISAGLGVLVLALVVLGVTARRRYAGERGHGVFPLVLFTFIYLAVLLLTSAMGKYDRIGDRLLAPVFIPLTLLLLVFFRDARKSLRPGVAGKGLGFVVLALVALTLFSWGRMAATVAVNRAKFGAGGYSSVKWQESPLCAHLRTHRLRRDLKVYSNAPDATYLFSGVSAERSPMKKGVAKGGWVRDREAPAAFWPEGGPVILVWFQGKYSREQFAPEELEGSFKLDQSDRFADGSVYIVSRR